MFTLSLEGFRPRQPCSRPFTLLALSAVEVSFEGALPISAPSLFSLFATKRTKLTPLFSYSSALFKKECLPKPFPINLFRTLSQNTRGCTLSAPSSFDFKPSTSIGLSVSPFVAALTRQSQLIANPAALSPAFATLTSFVNPNPFVCHSYKKHRGVGTGGRDDHSAFNFQLSTFNLFHSPCTTHNSPIAGQPPPRPPKRRERQLGVYSLPAGGPNNFPPSAFQKNL